MPTSLVDVFLADLSFLTSREKFALGETLGGESSLLSLTADSISAIVSRDARPKDWSAEKSVARAKRALRVMGALGVKMSRFDSADFPVLLRQIPDSPFALFYRGDISCLARATVSVVGTRRPTGGGRDAAVSFARDAARDGVTVVSGLAVGIDGAAHQGAIDAAFDEIESGAARRAFTAAILPCGVDTIAPGCHKRMARSIIETGGCIASEYLPGVPVEVWRFVHRNRIIAALSPATIVAQAPPGSGALITAQFALDYGRDVMFHEAAFSDEAAAMSRAVRTRLEKDFAAGKVSKSKLENTAERYLNDGAPVIKDYADFRGCMDERPGERAAESPSLEF